MTDYILIQREELNLHHAANEPGLSMYKRAEQLNESKVKTELIFISAKA